MFSYFHKFETYFKEKEKDFFSVTWIYLTELNYIRRNYRIDIKTITAQI